MYLNENISASSIISKANTGKILIIYIFFNQFQFYIVCADELMSPPPTPVGVTGQIISPALSGMYLHC